jgi:hypothetical protein
MANIGDTFAVREILFPLASAGEGYSEGVESPSALRRMRYGFSAPQLRNSAGRDFAATTERRNLKVSERRFSCGLAQLLPSRVAE